ncbi:unnamed protein product, partial [Ascophyllum nodosum]
AIWSWRFPFSRCTSGRGSGGEDSYWRRGEKSGKPQGKTREEGGGKEGGGRAPAQGGCPQARATNNLALRGAISASGGGEGGGFMGPVAAAAGGFFAMKLLVSGRRKRKARKALIEEEKKWEVTKKNDLAAINQQFNQMEAALTASLNEKAVQARGLEQFLYSLPDINEDGLITRYEFDKYMNEYKRTHPGLTDRDLPRFEDMDHNNNGHINFNEWEDYQMMAMSQMA